jgi:hypothetical protein
MYANTQGHPTPRTYEPVGRMDSPVNIPSVAAAYFSACAYVDGVAFGQPQTAAATAAGTFSAAVNFLAVIAGPVSAPDVRVSANLSSVVYQSSSVFSAFENPARSSGEVSSVVYPLVITNGTPQAADVRTTSNISLISYV